MPSIQAWGAPCTLDLSQPAGAHGLRAHVLAAQQTPIHTEQLVDPDDML